MIPRNLVLGSFWSQLTTNFTGDISLIIQHNLLIARMMADSERHYYEIIQEGHPCHLYFDIEYSITLNPGLDSASMMDIFKRLVCVYLYDKYGVNVGLAGIVDLESSSDAKFSRHLVVRIKDALFLCNEEMGSD
jgi:DNA-directed primase/polymerase protein